MYEAELDTNANVTSCRRLTDGRCTVNLPAYSRTSNTIHFIGIGPLPPLQSDIRARNVSLWQVDSGSDVAVQRCVSDPQKFDIDDSRIRPLVVEDDGRVTLSILARGAVELGAMLDGAWTPIIEGKIHVASYARADGVTTAVVMGPKTAGELVVMRGGATASLTDFGAQYREVQLHEYLELEGCASDGYPVHGWLMVPPGAGPHPLLLADYA